MQAGLAQPCSELPVQCSVSHRLARVGKSSVTRLDPDSPNNSALLPKRLVDRIQFWSAGTVAGGPPATSRKEHMTTTSPLTSVSRSGARCADDPLLWNRLKIPFVSTCPKCGHERLQHGYTRRILFDLLGTRRKIDAYCIDCNVCGPISGSERRGISQQ